VIYPDPGFPAYKALAQVTSCAAVPVPLDATKACYDLGKLEKSITPKTKLVIINSPSNPTGGVASLHQLQAVADLLARHPRVWLLSDEIYSMLVYDQQPSSARRLPCAPSFLEVTGPMRDRYIVVDGFSKTFCMTGWRLGFAVMPAELAERVHLLMVHTLGCTATFTQHAGIAALEGPAEALQHMTKTYHGRRDYVVERLNNMPGVRCLSPGGSFYVFPDISSLGLSAKEMQTRLLQEGFINVIAGTDFGAEGEGHIRISYVCGNEELEKGLDQMEKVLKTIGTKSAL